MNTLERGSDEPLYRSTWVVIGLSILRGIAYVIRLVIFAPLMVLEPVIRVVLSLVCLVGLLACVVYKLEDSTGVRHHFHYGLMFGFSIGSAVALALYYRLMRWLAP